MADGAAIYRIRCKTEAETVSTDGYVDVPPTRCPNDATHVVDPDSVVLIAREPAVEAIARSIASVRTMRYVPIDTSVQVRSALQRIASFTWHHAAARPLANVYVRGTLHGHSVGGSVGGGTSGGGGIVWLVVHDLDARTRIGVHRFVPPPARASTMAVDVAMVPGIHSDAIAPYPIEVYAWTSDRFSVESVAVRD
jgi:hypothetical protein